MVVVICLVVLCGVSYGQVVDLFHLASKEPFVKGIVTREAAYPVNLEDGLSEMELQMRGIYAVVAGKDLGNLLRSGVRVRASIERPADAVVLYYVHLVTAQGAKRSIAILQTGDGEIIGEEVVGMLTVMPMRAPINVMRFTAVSDGWAKFAGPFNNDNENGIVVGEVFELSHPYVCGRPFMDDRTIRNRGFVADRSQKVGTTRVLGHETIRVRLPAGYDAKKAAGLLVWVNAGSGGSPPAVFSDALDDMNMICAGADNSGNERPVADRYQLALDVVASVSARYHVDSRRVYVTGISGGGRISSMLYAAAPDVFTGTIAIVGLNFYKAIPTGDGRSWPATYRKPSGRLYGLMRQHRLAAMTGPPDFNYKPMAATIEVMKNLRLDAKLFSYLDMGHELPTADHFAEALAWVDEPYQKARERDILYASNLLERVHQQLEGGDAINAAQEKALRKVMDRAAWTDVGWEAFEMLDGGAGGDIEGGGEELP